MSRFAYDIALDAADVEGPHSASHYPIRDTIAGSRHLHMAQAVSPDAISEAPAVSFSADDPESGSGEDIELFVSSHARSGRVSRGRTQTVVMDTTLTLQESYTDSTAAGPNPPSVSLWVPLMLLAAYAALAVTCFQVIGWGTRMGHTTPTRPLIAPLGAPLGAHPAQSRVLAGLASLAGVLVLAAVLTVWVSGCALIERAARRPILPVFLEAVRHREKLSNTVVHPGWRTVVLGVGSGIGACAGAALLAAAAVEPATCAQRALLAAAAALLDGWAMCYLLVVATVGFYANKLPFFALFAGVVVAFFGVYFSIVAYALVWYYAAPYAMFLALAGLCVVFACMAWEHRNERLMLRGVW